MDKDFDYESFQKFMNHLSGFDHAVELERQARTVDIIETLDTIDEAVKSMPECPEAVNMLQHIGIKTE